MKKSKRPFKRGDKVIYEGREHIFSGYSICSNNLCFLKKIFLPVYLDNIKLKKIDYSIII